ncbi:MAG TPA: Crp/Fnr family transcriptional regulator [Acidimicrobiales bacterium]|jgi:CRP-like cAMP-binding protein
MEHLLAEADLFRFLPPESIALLQRAAVLRDLTRNEILFGQGDAPSEMYVVSSGRIAIANKSEDGRESMVALMERGDLFGEMGMFDEMGRSAEARALERSEVLAVPYAAVRAELEADPSQLWGVIRLLSQRLRTTDSALADAVFLDVTGRTAKRLLEIAGENESFTLPVTQEELAGMVGASRERVNKAISQFVKLGWLEQSDRNYRIIDRRQLEIRSG